MSNNNKALKSKALAEAKRLEAKYGHMSGATGADNYDLDIVPTGMLALDYALGTGGWPLGHPIEIFGPPDIGKSSVIGLSAIRNAQARGLLCGVVALEPGFDDAWAEKNGVDPEMVVIGRPDDGEAAFHMLYDWVCGDVIDFVLFDSIGAILRPSEAAADGKMAQGGQSGLITWGVKRIVTPAWKNNKGVMFLNQIRDDMGAQYAGAVDSPGGWALKHSCAVRVQVKPGKDRYTAKVDGEDVLVGRSLTALIKRNKLSEGTNQKAVFDYYQMETDVHGIGVDKTADVLATGIRTGVIKRAGAWYSHPTFPGERQQLQGRKEVEAFLAVDAKAYTKIREDVLDVMKAKQQALKDAKATESSDA